MGKWIGVGCLALVGFSLLDGHPLIGILMLALSGLIIWLAIRGSGGSSSYSMPTRPGQLASARYDAREEITAAERSAARAVRAAREDAEEQGQSALRAALVFLAQEPRWVG
ncbi:hypothetical protein LK464_15000 [Mycobacteroides abscessus subsp. abscessus]|uniref:hypothetical protein n=1 Tax=Mycobacteroides abscessus TaxID=36809 RepID=UPI001896695B|nr:hypothetical protein [Mycobacteroides abscessus]UEA22790.1 hypothetical protein LK464_15000 [Mycobacteroides abscessus subsp. abscessus]